MEIQKVLETWHGGFDYDGRVNMALSLVGEVGELTNLYRKWIFKPGYTLDRDKALEELGDVWYYTRLFAHFLGHMELEVFVNNLLSYNLHAPTKNEIFGILHSLHKAALDVEVWTNRSGYIDGKLVLGNLILSLSWLLKGWECTLEELTELNYKKLTENQDHHGWNLSPMMQDDYKEKYLGFDQAVGESKTVVGIWKKEEDGSFTSLGTGDTLEKTLNELGPDDFKIRYENEPAEEDWREQMQKRIAIQREEAIRNKGRWY